MKAPQAQARRAFAPRAISGRLVPLLLAAGLAGCASLPPAGDRTGFAPVQELARQHLGAEPQWPLTDEERRARDERVAGWLSAPLDAGMAVQVALANHRGLQAAFAELRIAEAEWVQASRLPNPGFSFGRSRQGDEREIERGLHLNLARWIAAPWVAPWIEQERAALRARVAGEVLALAADTRRAWVRAVAAREAERYQAQVLEAAEAGAELARRMAQVGNFNRLAQAREQQFQAVAALQLAQARHEAIATRERLVRLLGLWGDQAARLQLPERLPELPAEPADRPGLEREAMATRLDVIGARAATESAARALGLTRATRFVNVFELGLMRNSSNEGPSQTGWEIGFELPLFDSGNARLARAEALHRQAVERTAQRAIEARSEVREAWSAYRTAWDIARHHRDELVPLARAISDENLLRYNGMLIGVFELLADARAQIGTVQAAIAAQRDFWLAEADLASALVGRPMLLPAAAGAAGPASPAAGADPH